MSGEKTLFINLFQFGFFFPLHRPVYIEINCETEMQNSNAT